MPRNHRTPVFERGAPAATRARLRRAALCLVLVLCGGSAALAQPSLVSVNAAGTASGNGQESLTSDLSLSHDGRFVVFVSDSSDLVAGDTNGATDVFVRDLAAGTTRLVSVNAAGTNSGNARSGVTGPGVRSLSVSGNGRYVAFSSAASDLVAGDTNGLEDVFVRDLQTNTTVLASVTAAGGNGGNGASIFPFLTPDGSSVSFRSAASDLVTIDTNGAALDVFVRRLTTNTTVLASVNAAGNGSGNMSSSGISMSDDGRFITFTSRSNNLVANDTNGTTFLDVFVRDLQAGTTTLVSATPGNAGSGNLDSSGSLISANGARVVFMSRATNLTTLADTNAEFDLFVRDLQAGTTTLVSVNRQGTAAGSADSVFLSFPAISTDGNVVAFASHANDLTQNDTDNEPDIFARDIAAGVTTLISVSGLTGMSGDRGSGSNTIGMSGDGRFIAFESGASDLVGNDHDQPNNTGVGIGDVFVRDRLTSRTFLASLSTSNLSGHGDSLLPSVSRNGAVVAFSSRATDLDPRDTDAQTDVFAVALAASDVEFTAPTFPVNEGVGAATVTVRRTGDTTTEAFVNYETGDGNATARKDYTAAFGRLRFAPGETTKSFQVVITDDRFNDDNGIFGEGFPVTLTDPAGTTLGGQSTAFIVITDNDAADGPSPVKDASFDTEFFVRQHYADFLNRVPDAGGLAFWMNGIDSCGADQQCREVKKVDTSAAFFLSIEFQETGFLAYRTHKAAFGNLPGRPVPVRLREFLFDSRLIGENLIVGTPGWPEQLEANKQAYFNEFVTRMAITSLYPQTMTAAEFVDALFARAGVLPTQAERNAAVNAFGAGGNAGRAAALRAVAESQSLRQAETNRAFVLMQYFGYLRRNPDDPQDTNFDGFFFWLTKLDQFNGNYVEAEMVKAFIQSIEYGDRFGF